MTLSINGKTYEAGELVAYVNKLAQENAELKCECRRCVYTDCPCILSDYGKDRNGVCDHFKDVFDENAELKEKLESERDLPAVAYMQGAEKQKKKDEEELKKWKDEWQEQVQKATDEGYARTLQTVQLSKAKEHIQTLISCLIDWVQEGDKDYCHIAEAEDFLKDCDIDNAIQQANKGLDFDKIADEMEQDLKDSEE